MSEAQFTPYRGPRAAGLGLALLSAATFGTSGVFADALMASGWTPGAVVAVRVCLAVAVLTVPAVLQLRGRWRMLRRAAPQITSFGLIAVAGCQVCFFNAVRHLDVGVALLLEYSGILLVVLWLWLRHGQRPRRLTLIGVAASLGGLVLVLNPSGSGLDAAGVFWGLLAGTGLATYFVLSAKVADGVPPLAFAWAGMVVGGISLLLAGSAGALPARVSTADVELHGVRMSWVIPVLGIAVIAAAFAYSAGIAGTRILGAKLASFVGLTEVLFAALFAALALSQVPTAWQVAGGLVVLAGIALVRADEREAPAAEELPELRDEVPVPAG